MSDSKKSEWRRGRCECCGTKRVLVKRFAITRRSDPGEWDLCRICSETNLSWIVENLYDNADLARAIGGVANLLLREIRRARKPEGRRLGEGRGTILHHDEGPTLGPGDLGDPHA